MNFVKFLLSEKDQEIAREYKRGYQEASEKAGFHFINEVIPQEIARAREEGFKEGCKDSEGTKNGVKRYQLGYKDGSREALSSYRASLREEIEKMKNRHSIDAELFENSGGGEMCENCGKQGYIDRKEECSPDEMNNKLNQLLSLLDDPSM